MLPSPSWCIASVHIVSQFSTQLPICDAADIIPPLECSAGGARPPLARAPRTFEMDYALSHHCVAFVASGKTFCVSLPHRVTQGPTLRGPTLEPVKCGHESQFTLTLLLILLLGCLAVRACQTAAYRGDENRELSDS